MSKRCIVPRGFECTAHPVFFRFQEPPPLPIDLPLPLVLPSRRQSRRRESGEDDEGSEDAQLERQPPGVSSCFEAMTARSTASSASAAAAQRTPQTEGESGKEGEEERMDTTCPICLSRFLQPVTLVACAHQFCMDCILSWFNRTVTCPLCKSDGNCFVRSIQGVGLKMFAAVKGDSARAVPGADELAKAVNAHRRLVQQLETRRRLRRAKQQRSSAQSAAAEPAKKARMTLEEELEDVRKQLAEAERELAELDASSSAAAAAAGAAAGGGGAALA